MSLDGGEGAEPERSFDVLLMEACSTLQFAIDCWAAAWFHFGAETPKEIQARCHDLPHVSNVTADACQIATIITLGRLFDEKEQKLSIKTLATLANLRREEPGAQEKLRVIRGARSSADAVWDRLKPIRDHAVAHAPSDRSLAKVFDDSALKYDEVFACLEATKVVLSAFGAFAAVVYSFDPKETVRADLLRLWLAIDRERLEALTLEPDELILKREETMR